MTDDIIETELRAARLRIAELETAGFEAERRLRRLASIANPRDKLLMGYMEQIHELGLTDRFSTLVVQGTELVVARIAPGQEQPDPAVVAWMRDNPTPPLPFNEPSIFRTAFLSRQPVTIDDTSDAYAYFPRAYAAWRTDLIAIGGMRPGSIVAFPLVCGGEAAGVVVLSRLEVRPFTDEDIATIQPIADQMALAIGNARAAEKLELRNAELAEALERQTAVAGVLQTISRSAFDEDARILRALMVGLRDVRH